MDDITIGTLPKNTRETIAVALRVYKNHRFCDLRIMASKPDGEPVFTAKGFGLKPQELPALIELLKPAHTAALQAGWCTSDVG